MCGNLLKTRANRLDIRYNHSIQGLFL